MKKRLITATLLMCLIAICGAQVIGAGARTLYPAENANIVVTGTASVKAQADECGFFGSIEVAANDLASAERKNAEIFKIVRDAFAPYGSIRENDFSVSPLCGQAGYTATRYLAFTTPQTDKIDEIRGALARAGITGLNGITYSCTDDTDYKNRALALAIEDARAKAATLDPAAELVEIEELSCYPRYYDNCGGPADTVTYSATVRAVFA